MSDLVDIVIAGAGASGYFAAIACAESLPDSRVLLLEKSQEPLAKVMISGGGRCNVTHACFEPERLVTHYPRGGRALLGPFHRWQPRDTIRWFEERGVPLKVEPDGRMFPVSNQSASIAGCLKREAEEAGVELRLSCGLVAVERIENGFNLTLSEGTRQHADRLMIATGGNQNSPMFKVVESLGHTIRPLCPSLFSFDITDNRLKDLAGISVSEVDVTVPGTGLRSVGPLLVTHWGLSGPAILKLSAWGAVTFAEHHYHFDLLVNWVPGGTDETLREALQACRVEQGRKLVGNSNPWKLPLRLWQALIADAGVRQDVQWSQLPRDRVKPMLDAVLRSRFKVEGKSMNKDEFVTCGGVHLDEINFKTMGSRVCPGLYFGGEILDIDGVTGGFNFQAAWTTGWIAGKSMGQEG